MIAAVVCVVITNTHTDYNESYYKVIIQKAQPDEKLFILLFNNNVVC